MRINKDKSTSRIDFKWLWLVPIAVALYFGFDFLKAYSTNSSQATYFCGAEKIDGNSFVSASGSFSTSCKLSKEKKFSGSSSCHCGGEARFGMTAEIRDLKPGDTLVVNLRHWSEGCKTKLVFSSSSGYYFAEPKDGVSSNKWTNLSSRFVIPSGEKGSVWKVYPYRSTGNGSAYYDDFKIEIQRLANGEIVQSFPSLELQINDQNFKKIRKKRKEAFEKGLLFSSKEDLVSANIRIDSTVFNARVRLKGDLLDHLRDHKWSFRVMLDGKKEWNGMSVFSIHNSKSRSHIAEWFMHQLLKDEGILTPEYDFFKLILNNKEIGVYAYEQHFDNYMLFKNNKLIGPIIRHNDEGYWNNVKGKLKEYEWAAASQIELFNKENDGDQDFMALFDHGHSLLTAFLRGKKNAVEVFDLEKMAKYYAIIEAGHGTHAQLLTNIRFYIHPITGKLEPIGYDFYGESLPNITEDWRPVGQWENGDKIHERSRTGEIYKHRLFADQDFTKKYMFYLEQFTKDNYLKGRYDQYRESIKRRVDLINQDKDYKGYVYDFEKHFKKAPFTQTKIYPLPDVSLKSYRAADRNSVILQSFHYFPMEVVGYMTKNKEHYLDSMIVLDPYFPESAAKYHKIKCEQKPDQILYRTYGLDSIFYHDINNTLAPNNDGLSNIEKLKLLNAHEQISTQRNVLRLSSENLVISEPMVVLENETLEIHSGSKIELTDRGSLTIYGGVMSVGSKDAPVVFKGTNSQGVLIANSNRRNEFIHTSFMNLGQYHVGVVNRPAALNVYESEVFFHHCIWTNNDAKNDLSLVNAEFHLDAVTFLNNSGSAIESFYSNGKANNVNGENYGSQFIDINGGSIEGKDWKLAKILGNAIEIGQHGHLKLRGLNINNSNVALIARDHSVVTVSKYSGKNMERDIEVYGNQKPVTRVVVSEFANYKKRKLFIEDGVFCKINGSHQKMK